MPPRPDPAALPPSPDPQPVESSPLPLPSSPDPQPAESPPPPLSPSPFFSLSEAETVTFGKTLAAHLGPGMVVVLAGDLGAGKTALCRGIAEGLGCRQALSSPSYALVKEYETPRGPLYHLDLYRLSPGADLEEIGLDHYLEGEGICLIEWASQAGEGRIRPDFSVALSFADGPPPGAGREGTPDPEGEGSSGGGSLTVRRIEWSRA